MLSNIKIFHFLNFKLNSLAETNRQHKQIAIDIISKPARVGV